MQGQGDGWLSLLIMFPKWKLNFLSSSLSQCFPSGKHVPACTPKMFSWKWRHRNKLTQQTGLDAPGSRRTFPTRSASPGWRSVALSLWDPSQCALVTANVWSHCRVCQVIPLQTCHQGVDIQKQNSQTCGHGCAYFCHHRSARKLKAFQMESRDFTTEWSKKLTVFFVLVVV